MSDKYGCMASFNHLHEFTGFSVTIQLQLLAAGQWLIESLEITIDSVHPQQKRSANDVIITVYWSVSCVAYTPPWLLIEILKTATATQKQERSWHALEIFEYINIQVDLNRLRHLYAQGNPALMRNPEFSQFYNFKSQQVGTSSYNNNLNSSS